MDLDQLDQRLKYAAESGDTNALYSLIKEDPYILERIDKVPFVDSPLHTASRVGHFDFVQEIMRLKPSFAKKLNQDGLYPIHLAAMEGRFEVLRALLRFDRGLARLQGREGKTCLHYAAAKGDLLLLETLLLACPQSMKDVTDASETALHIALKLSNFDAFYFLLRTLRTACHQGSAKEEGRILNFKDVEGNTLLHIAVSMNQPQASQIPLIFILNLHILRLCNFSNGNTQYYLLKENLYIYIVFVIGKIIPLKPQTVRLSHLEKWQTPSERNT